MVLGYGLHVAVRGRTLQTPASGYQLATKKSMKLGTSKKV